MWLRVVNNFFYSFDAVSQVITPLVGLNIVLIGVFLAVGAVAQINAYQTFSPSLVAVVGIAEVPLAYTWALIWLNERLDTTKGIGVGFIAIALVIIMYFKIKLKENKDEKTDVEMEEIIEKLEKWSEKHLSILHSLSSFLACMVSVIENKRYKNIHYIIYNHFRFICLTFFRWMETTMIWYNKQWQRCLVCQTSSLRVFSWKWIKVDMKRNRRAAELLNVVAKYVIPYNKWYSE